MFALIACCRLPPAQILGTIKPQFLGFELSQVIVLEYSLRIQGVDAPSACLVKAIRFNVSRTLALVRWAFTLQSKPKGRLSCLIQCHARILHRSEERMGAQPRTLLPFWVWNLGRLLRELPAHNSYLWLRADALGGMPLVSYRF